MPRHRFTVVVLAVALLAGLLWPPVAFAEDPPAALPLHWDLTSAPGHFYRQTSGIEGAGYIVSNDDGMPFWDTYRQFGPAGLGYPISQRFVWKGRVSQVFQRGVLQFDPNLQSIEAVNLLDELSALGLDDWLAIHHGIPPREQPDALPTGVTLAETAELRAGLLEADPRFAAFYRTLRDPLYLFGMPTSQVQDIGSVRAVRMQRGVLQIWLHDVPWARAGQVTSALVGSLAAELELFPPGEHWNPVPPPEPPPARPVFDERTPMDPSTVQVPPGRRWIDVDLTTQRIYAMVDDTPVFWAPATTGKPGHETPTGRFRILRRVFNETMDSATLGVPRDSPDGYYYENIYFTQYFDGFGNAIHANYWQPISVFGSTPTSHGCVGLFYKDAEFFWSFARLGTEVVIHD